MRSRVEESTGADVSGVRVHTGAASQDAASSMAANAYTTGSDIHFAAGQYAPGTPAGDHLIAHEAVHTIQQAGGTSLQRSAQVSQPGDAAEVEAERAADAIVGGQGPVQVTERPGATVQRDGKGNTRIPLPHGGRSAPRQRRPTRRLPSCWLP